MSNSEHIRIRRIEGTRQVVCIGDDAYPEALGRSADPPERLYVIGGPAALSAESVAIVGARRATPYGLVCARRFAKLAAEAGFCVVSGGARGIGAEAHRAALEAGGATVAVLAGGLDSPYPAENFPLFQRIVDAGGALVSEQPWDRRPTPHMFRGRNRIVSALAGALLACEVGLPSGSFSACDDALAAGKLVLAVPGPITSAASGGSNRLVLSGAAPVVDDESFLGALRLACGRG